MTGVADRRDQGSASVELVLATPLVILLLMAAVQFTIWSHAAHMARAAANEGVQTARAYGSSAAAGQADTTAILDALGGNVLRGATVTVVRTETTATVRIRGRAAPVIPGLSLPVTVSVTAPVERVR
jgi:Flp pilus assembly protein TadG